MCQRIQMKIALASFDVNKSLDEWSNEIKSN